MTWIENVLDLAAAVFFGVVIAVNVVVGDWGNAGVAFAALCWIAIAQLRGRR